MAFDFWKYHGWGNDFVLVDAREKKDLFTEKQVRAICERNLGVGANGVLYLLHSELADFKMIIHNADGSRPEMCGNGLRCFARFLYEQGHTQAKTFTVETDRGTLACSLHLGDDGLVKTVKVDMGAPILKASEVPMNWPDEQCIDQEICIGEACYAGSAISMGNPHFVIFQKADQEARRLAPDLESHSVFPKRANIEFVDVLSPTKADVVVYERGCGFTQACGTGACAVVVAGVLTGRFLADAEVEIRLPGGSLWIVVPADLSTVWMRGPAVPVFSGRWEQ